MIRILLLVVLALALLIELTLTFGAFFNRSLTLQQFGVALSPDTSFLGYVVAWLLLFVSLVCALALAQIWQRDARFPILCYLLGIWWMGIGIGIYIAFGKPDNLFLDTLKGFLIVILTSLYARRERPVL